MDTKVFTFCYQSRHFELLPEALPSWTKQIEPTNIFVGFPDRIGESDYPEFFAALNQTGVNSCPVPTKFYGYAYNHLLEATEFQHAIILAPYVIPKEWLLGSVATWLETYYLVGKFKPPRVLETNKLQVKLIAPIIVELGRLNFDFLAVRHEALTFLDLRYRQWRFGSVLIRARPGAYALYNMLAIGDLPVLMLSHSVKPVKYLKRR